jgi:hypothetical protein
MHKGGVVLAVALVAAVQLSACSSSSSRFTSLDPGKTFTSLSAGERQQFCEDRFQYMSSRVSADDRKKIACSRAAGAAAGTGASGTGASDAAAGKASCQQVYQACMNVPSPELESSCDTFAKSAAGCVATVDEATQCAQAQADALEKLVSTADDTCKDLGKTAKKSAPVKSPEACNRVSTLCPKLFDESALDEGKSPPPARRP